MPKQNDLRLDFYTYFGDECAGRYAYTAVDSTGNVVPAGYGSRLVSYSNCANEVAVIPAAAQIAMFTKLRLAIGTASIRGTSAGFNMGTR